MAIPAIIACLLWSSAFAGVKIGLQYTTPIHFAGLRFMMAGLLVFPLAFRNNPGYFMIIRRNLRMILLFAFMQTFLQYVMFYKGITLIPASVAAIVIGSQPLFVTIVAHYLMPGDRITILKTLIILAGILGVFLVSIGKDPNSLTGSIVMAGILLMLAVNILSGFTNVLVARENMMIPPLVISSASMIIGGIGLFLISIPMEGLHFMVKPEPYYISLAWLSLLSAIAVSIWITLLKRPGTKVSDLNLWKFLIPLFGAVLSWLLVPGEEPQLLSIIGMVVIAVSLVALNLVNRNKHLIIQEKI